MIFNKINANGYEVAIDKIKCPICGKIMDELDRDDGEIRPFGDEVHSWGVFGDDPRISCIATERNEPLLCRAENPFSRPIPVSLTCTNCGAKLKFKTSGIIYERNV